MSIVAETEQIADRRNSRLESRAQIFDGSARRFFFPREKMFYVKSTGYDRLEPSSGNDFVPIRRCPRLSGKFVPGRHVTDRQMRLSMKLRSREIPTIAAARVRFSAGAAYRFEGDGRTFPFDRKVSWGRRCSDPLAGICTVGDLCR